MSKQYTKEDIKTVVRLWTDRTLGQIAQELDTTPQSVAYLAKTIRKYHDLPKKRITGKYETLVKEALKELDR